jgi:hypothetical protein
MSDMFETSGPRKVGTLAAYRDYWAQYPDAFDRALRPRPRQATAQEVFPHIDAQPSAPSTTRAAASGAAPDRVSSPARSGDFFSDPIQKDRGATSPLGGVAKSEQKPTG